MLANNILRSSNRILFLKFFVKFYFIIQYKEKAFLFVNVPISFTAVIAKIDFSQFKNMRKKKVWKQ